LQVFDLLILHLFPSSTEHIRSAYHPYFYLLTAGVIAIGVMIMSRDFRALIIVSDRGEEWFRAFFDNAPMSMSVKDQYGRFLQINKSHEAWLDRPASEVIGKTRNELFPDSMRRDDLRNVEKIVLETGEVHQAEFKILKLDGRTYDRAVTKFRIGSPDGGGAYLGTFTSDITELKRTEREIAEKSVLLQIILDAVPNAISFRDTKGRFVFVSIVKSLVDLHDGELVIESELGVGTSISVNLPY
jgi:PAS domain S-box-containing protein